MLSAGPGVGLGHPFHSLKGDWGKDLQAFSRTGLRFLLPGPSLTPNEDAGVTGQNSAFWALDEV